MNPLSAVTKAITFPFHALFVTGLCFFINWFTSPHVWWAQWVAFGMAVALLCVWARALRVIVTTVGVAGGAYLLTRWWTARKTGAPFDPVRQGTEHRMAARDGSTVPTR